MWSCDSVAVKLFAAEEMDAKEARSSGRKATFADGTSSLISFIAAS